MKIFVQIASYRDPQLIPTIKDMLANAKKPKNLVFSIARQFAEEDGFDNLDEYRNDKRFKILDIPYEEAKGVCWARHQVQQLYKFVFCFRNKLHNVYTIFSNDTKLFTTFTKLLQNFTQTKHNSP